MKKWVKRAALIIIAAGILAAVVYSMTLPLEFETYTLKTGDIENTFTEKGRVDVPDMYGIFAVTGGKLTAVDMKEGDDITAGQTVAAYDASELYDQREQLLTELAVLDRQRDGLNVDAGQSERQSQAADNQIKAQILALETQIRSLENSVPALEVSLEQARDAADTYNRQLEAAKLRYELGEISEQELMDARELADARAREIDAITAQIDAVPNQVESVRAQISGLEEGLGLTGGLGQEQARSGSRVIDAQKATIHKRLEELNRKIADSSQVSEVSGLVSKLYYEAGQVVAQGEKLADIYNPGDRIVRCDVLVDDLGGMSVGDAVEITLKQRSGDKVFAGNISKIGLEAKETTSSLGLSEKRIEVEISASGEVWQSLGLGWPLDVKFTTAKAADCLYAPKTAIFQTQDGYAVWLIRDGEVTAAEVTRGLQTASATEITGDLKDGDVIILDAGEDTIKEGIKAAAIEK